MRVVRVVRQALLDLLGSGSATLVLMVAVRELSRPAQESGLLNDLMPVATARSVCVLVIAAVLFILWLGARSVGRGRGTILGATLWLARTGLWWSIVALAVFAGVAFDGSFTHGLGDLNWRFALGYLVVTLAILVACALAWRRSMERLASP